MRQYLLEHPCVDCGNDDPVVLEFDHLRDKTYDISRLMSGWPWSTILAEIEKCEVVCANCHRRRTYARAGSARSGWTRVAATQQSE
jgi:L-lysine 2,3-aminomutase